MITSILTILGGKVVYAADEFASLDESSKLPISPDWSPIGTYGGYYQPTQQVYCSCHEPKKTSLDTLLGITHQEKPLNPWSFGCDCFAY